MHDNTCTATTNAGNPCRRKRVRGSDKCQAHGGVAGQAVFDESKFKTRCSAKSTRSGEQCRKPAIKGGTVCRTHGGNLPVVKKKAKERFRELEEPMVDLAHKMVEKALAGQMSDGDTMRLMSFIGDRLGYQRGITVEHTQDAPWQVTMQHIITEIPEGYDPYAHQRQLEDIEDAEVVEESLPPVSDHSKHEAYDGPKIGPGTREERMAGRAHNMTDPIQRGTPFRG